jgi:hypothetical protein
MILISMDRLQMPGLLTAILVISGSLRSGQMFEVNGGSVTIAGGTLDTGDEGGSFTIATGASIVIDDDKVGGPGQGSLVVNGTLT